MKKFKVFSRRWWKDNSTWPGGLEPHPRARKYTIGYADTEESARDMCRVWCANNAPGRYSRKAEYTSEF